MTRQYPDEGSTSDWLKQISLAARPIRGTTQIWVVTRHQYAACFSGVISGETSGGVAKCRLPVLRPIKILKIIVASNVSDCILSVYHQGDYLTFILAPF